MIYLTLLALKCPLIGFKSRWDETKVYNAKEVSSLAMYSDGYGYDKLVIEVRGKSGQEQHMIGPRDGKGRQNNEQFFKQLQSNFVRCLK